MLSAANGFLEVPTILRHLHTSSGKLRATIVAVPVKVNRFAVGIARANKNERASRSAGRALAFGRLARGLGLPLITMTEKEYASTALKEKEKNLFVELSDVELAELIANKTPAQWGSRFGTSEKNAESYKKRAVAQQKRDQAEAKKRKADRQAEHAARIARGQRRKKELAILDS